MKQCNVGALKDETNSQIGLAVSGSQCHESKENRSVLSNGLSSGKKTCGNNQNAKVPTIYKVQEKEVMKSKSKVQKHLNIKSSNKEMELNAKQVAYYSTRSNHASQGGDNIMKAINKIGRRAIKDVKKTKKNVKISPKINKRCNALYDLSKKNQLSGKKRREEIIVKNSARKHDYNLYIPKNNIPARNKYSQSSLLYEKRNTEKNNFHKKVKHQRKIQSRNELQSDKENNFISHHEGARYEVLYNLSKKKQSIGKKRREEILSCKTKIRSSTLFHPLIEENSNINVSPRLLHLYESGRESIRLKMMLRSEKKLLVDR